MHIQSRHGHWPRRTTYVHLRRSARGGKGLLEEDKNNKRMLSNWKIQREVLTHIMAGTMPVDHAELSKARKSVSAFMNPAALQSEINKLDSGVQPAQEAPRKLLPPMKRSWPEGSDKAMNASKKK